MIAHGVQIGYCVLNNGFLRVYVEHWHGNISSSQLQPNGGFVVAPMSITTVTTSGTITQVRNAEGAAPGTTRFNLPGCGSNITLLAGCNSANRENNWFYWDFPPAACNAPVTVTFNAGLNAYTTEECTSLYPRTIQASFADQGGPALNCPDMIFNSCSPVLVNSYNFTAVDDCDPNPVVTVNPTAPHTFNPGSTPVTVVATDNLSQTTTCVFFVNVNQPGGCNSAPIAVCQNLSLNANGNCQGNASAASFDGGSSDPDGDPMTFSVSPSGPYGLGTTNVTLSVSDGVLSATCTASITVIDVTPPTISCPANITVNNDAGNCGANNVSAGNATFSDNCGIVSAGDNNPGFLPVGTTTVTHTVSDAAGLTASCSNTITVVDAENPTIACPANITFSNDAGNCSAVVTYATPSGADNCPGSSTTQTSGPGNGGTFPLGVTTETYAVTDAASNSATCSFTVTVTDNENPTIACPANITVSNDAGNCSAVVTYATPSGADNCPGSSTAQTAGLGSGGTFPLGITTETYVVTDAASNSASCSFTVTVNDNENPTIACPANITVSNDAGNCSAVVSYTTPSGADNCPGSSTAQTAGLGNGGTFPLGVTTETFIVTDAASNSATCSFTVTVNHTENPTISCPADMSLRNDPGICSAVHTYSVSSSDNCSVSHIQTSGLASGAAYPVGTTTNSFTAKDGSGNNASCSWTVRVNDAEAPNAICNNSTVQLNASGSGSISASDIDGGSTDNCGIAALSASPMRFNCSNVGSNTVVLTVTDIYGNTSTCQAQVTVIDPIAPQITCPPSIITSTDTGLCGAIVIYAAVQATDNCPNFSITQVSGSASGGFSQSGTTFNLFTITDVSGNPDTCSFTVTVNDNQNPTLTLPDSIFQNADPGMCGASVTIFGPTKHDNCGITYCSNNYNFTSDATDFYPVGTTTINWTIADAAGNTATGSHTVTVLPLPLELELSSPDQGGGFNLACNGDSDGEALVDSVKGGCSAYSYIWSNGDTTKTASGLSAGTHSVTITDALGDTITDSIILTEPSLLESNLVPSVYGGGFNISCAGDSSGTALAQASGGVPPYSYLWSNGSTDSLASNLSAGTYQVSITDMNGCTTGDTVTLTEPDSLTVDAGPDQTVYLGYPDSACAFLQASGQSGGVLPYSYEWKDDQGNTVATTDTVTVCPTTSTTYTLTLTDSNGCQATDQVTVCVTDVRCYAGNSGNQKVLVCHLPPGNPANEQNICVSEQGARYHLAQVHGGDYLGPCGVPCDVQQSNKNIVDEASQSTRSIQFSVFPNPFRESTTIRMMASGEETISLSLFSSMGIKLKEIWAGKLEDNQNKEILLNNEGLDAGVYQLQLRTASGMPYILQIVLVR